MTDSKYNFESTIGIKLVVKKDDKIFLIKEPQTNEWMPGRLSLPGGKLLLGESILNGIDRKISTDVGFNVKIEGLAKIVNILMPSKNVYHLVFVAKYVDGEVDLSKIEAENADWYSGDEILELTKNDFAEYYNDEVLRDIIKENFTFIPLSILGVQDNRQEEIMDWMKLGMPDKKF
jgi:ADP-ribose pyrophosphatase YjhB (NUDIX family)